MSDSNGSPIRTLAVGLGFIMVLAAIAPISYHHLSLLEERAQTKEAVNKHLSRADDAMKGGDLARALVALEAARALAPSDPALQEKLMVARVRWTAEKASDGKDADVVEYALDVTGRDSAVALVAAARLDNLRGKSDDALAKLKSAVQKDPAFVPGHLALGNLHRSAGRLPESLTSFEAAVQHSPTDAQALNNLGVTLADLDRREEAVKMLNQALTVQDQASTRINLANILAPLERYSEAVAHLQRAAQLQPESVQVWRQLGAALLKAKRPAESEAALRRALAIRADPAVAYELALVLQAGEKFQDAALVLRKVVEATPDHVDAAYQLGATLQRLGDIKGARQALQHYLSVSVGRDDQATRVAEVRAALAPAKAPAPAAAPANPGPGAPAP